MALSAPPALQASSDHALLDAWRTGDEAAFTALVERHLALVTRACQRQVGSGDADDAAQAVFLVLARKSDDAAACPALPAWLLTVARHVCATVRRGRARRDRAEHQVPTAVTTSPAEPSEALAALDDVLAALPERERIAVSLHYLAGQPQTAIATALRCPVNTVYSLVHRGLERARDLLRRRGVVMPVAAITALLLSEQASAAELTWSASTTTALAHGASPSSTVTIYSSGALKTMSRIRFRRRALSAAALLLLGGSTIFAVNALGADVPSPQSATPHQTPVAHDPVPALLRLIDVNRSRQRFANGPHARLLATEWGKSLLAKMSPDNRKKFDAMMETISTTRSVAVSATFDSTPAIETTLVHTTDRDTYVGQLSSWIPNLPAADPIAELRYSGALPPIKQANIRSLPDSAIESPVDASADLELCLSGTSWCIEALNARLKIPQDPEAEKNLENFNQQEHIGLTWSQVTFRQEPFGLRERYVTYLTEVGKERSKHLPASELTTEVFAKLPAETLCALAISTEAFAASEVEPDALKQVAQLLEQFHLPPWETIRDGLHGNTVISMESGAPLPVLNLWIGMDAAMADTLLTAADKQLGLMPDNAGSHSGFLGMIPVAAAYRDGSLVITTHALGLAGLDGRPAGFLNYPEIRSAMREIPGNSANVIGLSRSGPSWAALANLAAPMLASQGEPSFATMPADLQRNGSYGFCWMKTIDDRSLIEAGGLFGGFMSMTAFTVATPAILNGEWTPLMGAIGMLAK